MLAKMEPIFCDFICFAVAALLRSSFCCCKLHAFCVSTECKHFAVTPGLEGLKCLVQTVICLWTRTCVVSDVQFEIWCAIWSEHMFMFICWMLYLNLSCWQIWDDCAFLLWVGLRRWAVFIFLGWNDQAKNYGPFIFWLNIKGCCYMDPKINMPNLACYILGLDLLLLLALTWPKGIKTESCR